MSVPGEEMINDKIEREKKEALNASIDYGLGKSPDAHAELLKSAKKVGVPIDVADRKSSEINKLAQYRELMDRLQNSSTELKTLYEDPDFAAIAHDDVDILTQLDNTAYSILDFMKHSKISKFLKKLYPMIDEVMPDISTIERLVKTGSIAVESPQNAIEIAQKSPSRLMAGMAESVFNTGEEAATLMDVWAQADRDISKIFGVTIPEGQHLMETFSSQLKGARNQPLYASPMLRSMFPELDKQVKAFEEKGIPMYGAGQWWRKDAFGDTKEIEYALQGIESTGGTALGMTLSLATGKAWPMLAAGFSQEGGSMSEQMRAAGYDPYSTFIGSSVQGTIEVATERLPQLKLLQNLKLGKGFGKTLVDQWIQELPQEQIATLGQDATEFIYLRPEATLGDYIAERPEAFYQTLIATISGTTAHTAGSYGTMKLLERLSGQEYPEALGEISRAEKAVQRQGLIDEIDRLAADSKLRERHPEAFMAAMETIKERADVDHVYINSESFFQTLDQAGLDIEEVAQILPIQDQIQYIREHGGDFQIPFEEFMAKVAGTDVGEMITPHIRFDPDEMSQSQAEQWMETAQERILEDADIALNKVEQTQAFIDSANRVESNIRDKLLQTNRVTKDVAAKYASLHKAMAVTLSDRYPSLFAAPEDVYKRYGLAVRGAPIAGMTTFEQQDLPPDKIKSTIGIDVEEITDEKEIARIQQEYQRHIDALQQQSTEGFDVLKNISDGSSAQGWAGATRITGEDNLPLIVYRGSKTPLKESSFFKERLGGSSGHPSSGLGVFFTPHIDEARGYGPVISNVYMDIRNPKIFPVEDLPGFDSVQEATAFRERLRKEGYDGIVVDARHLKDADGVFGPINYIAFDPEQVIRVPDAQELFQEQPTFFSGLEKATEDLKQEKGQPLFQEKRGKIQFPADITQAPSVISLLENADLSTFLHESGHFFFEMYRDIASQPNAPEQIYQDMDALVKFAGVKSLDEWNNMSAEQRRAGHERVAEAFEVYLFEGKAPSTELQSLFQTFRAWLVNAYKQLRQYLSPDKITDEVRGVFDRMLATDEAIVHAERMRGLTPAFDSQDQIGATDDQWAAYKRDLAYAHEGAIDEVQARANKDMQWLSGAKSRELKKLQSKANTLRRSVKEEVTKEVQDTPVYRAMYLLKNGTFPDTEMPARKVKLDADVLSEMYKDTNVKWQRLRNMKSRNGIHPDMVAPMFGFSSGDALVRAILDAEPEAQVIKDMTDRRMLERHGDLSNTVALQEAADQAVHNLARGKVIATEARFLARLAKTTAPNAAIAKDAAERLLGDMQTKDIKPNRFEVEERKASSEMRKAWKDGDYEKAARQSQRQLLNFHLAKKAQSIQDQVDKNLKYVKKFDKPSVRKNIDPDQLDQIDDLRRGFDFSKSTTLKEIAKRESLQQWVDRHSSTESEVGYDPIIDVDLMERIKRKHYKTMTASEMKGLMDSIKNIEHIGRLKKKILTAEDNIAYAEKIAQVRQSLRDNANRTVKEKPSPTDVYGRTIQGVESFNAEHRKVASLVREMDASKDGGAMWELYIKPMNEAGDKETRMRAMATERMSALFDDVLHKSSKGGLPFNIYTQKRAIPGTGISMSYEERVMFGMNWGNLGNRQRLIDGGLSGKKSLTKGEAQAILNTLEKEDWDFIQGVWDYIAEFKPQIAEQERRLTGVTPEWIDSVEVVTPYGIYPGGYFPAKYDTLLSARSEAMEAATNLRQGMKGAFNAAAARNGYTQKRANQVKGRPILLSFNAITQHVNEVIHRLSWQDWLTDANRIVKSLDRDIREHYGPHVLKQFHHLNRDIAQGEQVAQNTMESFINHARIGTTIQGMGLRLTTALIQSTGYAQSIARIGLRWTARGVATVVKHPVNAMRVAMDKSSMMRDRASTLQREVNEIMNKARAGKGVNRITSTYFLFIYKMQQMVDLPTWHGAYEKAQAQLNIENAVNEKERQLLDKKAVAMADQAVIDSQGGGQIKDLARVQRGSPYMKMFTNFYSYFNVTYNMNAEAFRRTNFKSPAQIAALFVDLLTINVLPVVLSVLIRQAMTGECDDMDCMSKKLINEQATFMTGQMVGLRDVGSSVYAITEGKAFGYQGPPGAKVFSETYNLMAQSAQGEADAAWWRALSSLTGILFHLPTGQVYDTAEGMVAIGNGETDTAVEDVQALMTGAPKK